MWRSIFLDSLYLRSRRLRIRILLIQVTFSGIRALAVPFLLPGGGGNEVRTPPGCCQVGTTLPLAFNPPLLTQNELCSKIFKEFCSIQSCRCTKDHKN